MSGIKLFFSYISANFKWIVFIFLSGLVMSIVMMLNGIPAEEIVYGMGLCLFLLIIITAVAYHRFCSRYRKLTALEKSIAISLDGLEPPENLMEGKYHKLLAILLQDKSDSQSAMEQRARDFKEYYTMWVHQIKTPISAMRLLLQEKNEETDMTEEMDELFRIEQYVEMALQYMRLDSDTTDFLIRKTDLDAVIREAVHKYARLFIRKKIKLEYSGVNASVLTDEKWTEFVIEQILSNAIKYTAGGSIRIFMEKENVLVIEDTGIGISAEDLPRVFEKGYTGYNGHADKRSTGIGLYLCSKIMKKLSHGLEIQSEERKGTKVFLTFPDEDALK